jgi:hypothetical protein
MFLDLHLQILHLLLLQGHHIFSQFSSSSSYFTKFFQYCKKQGHDKSKCFKLKKKTLIVQSPNEEDDDAPIEVSSEDMTYEELRGLNKVTLLATLHSPKSLR